MKIYLSFSSWSTWKQCPKKFQFQYIDRCASESSSALLFGTQLHSMLEAKYLQKPPAPLTLPEPHDTLDPRLPFPRYSNEHASRLFSAYERRWAGDKFRALRAEVSEQIEIAPGIYLNAVVDTLGEQDGEIVVMEHKTTSMLKDFDQKAFLSLQGVIYALVAEKLGYKATGVIFNGLNTSWGKTHKKLVSDPNSMFSRTYVPIEAWQKDETLRILERDANRMIEDIKGGEFSKHAPHSCLSFFRLCPFAEVCKTAPEDRAEFVKTLEKRKPHKFKVEL